MHTMLSRKLQLGYKQHHLLSMLNRKLQLLG